MAIFHIIGAHKGESQVKVRVRLLTDECEAAQGEALKDTGAESQGLIPPPAPHLIPTSATGSGLGRKLFSKKPPRKSDPCV